MKKATKIQRDPDDPNALSIGLIDGIALHEIEKPGDGGLFSRELVINCSETFVTIRLEALEPGNLRIEVVSDPL